MIVNYELEIRETNLPWADVRHCSGMWLRRSRKNTNKFSRVSRCLDRLSNRVPWYFKAPWLLYMPPGLTFRNSIFCPHSALTYFVHISKQTATLFWCNLDW